MDRWIDASIRDVAAKLATPRPGEESADTSQGLGHAGREAIYGVVDSLIGVLLPGCHGPESLPEQSRSDFVAEELRRVALTLKRQVEKAFHFFCQTRTCETCHDCITKAEDAVRRLIESLPEIQRILGRDIAAAYEGDPAARSMVEVVVSYPCLIAVVTHRIAHVLYRAGVPLIPRIMSERAHSQTGIDIHPGAEIGGGFFIDHGTGVVIGETCRIGDGVKLYQGVTLGALSFPKDEHGNLIKGIKRHPNVEDNVTIYAGATILGGNTTIGAGSEIGGNVWLTRSVPPGSKVYNQQPKPLIRNRGEAQPASPETS
jgi:serine O-acetyltransferase